MSTTDSKAEARAGWNIVTSIARDELSITTWLLLGAFVQSLITLSLPIRYALTIPVGFLACRCTLLVLTLLGIRHNERAARVRYGRYSALMPDVTRIPKRMVGQPGMSPEPEDEVDVSEDERRKRMVLGGEGLDQPGDGNTVKSNLTVFVIGFTSTHPLGRLAPGMETFGTHVASIWASAESSPLQTGYLGRTPALLSTDQSRSNAMFVISYWRSSADLHAFSSAAEHAAALRWFYEHTQRYPHLGIMHELYDCPKGRWEDIYGNFTPFGTLLTRYPVPPAHEMQTEVRKEGGQMLEDAEGDGVELVNAVVIDKGKRIGSMLSRMGGDTVVS